jgi:hypothetical protein
VGGDGPIIIHTDKFCPFSERKIYGSFLENALLWCKFDYFFPKNLQYQKIGKKREEAMSGGCFSFFNFVILLKWQ